MEQRLADFQIDMSFPNLTLLDFPRVPWLRIVVLSTLVLGTTSAIAAATVEEAFVLNTFAFLIWGCLVMWMCAGFTMLESGSVRTKNSSMICMKNIGLYAIAAIMYFTIGYNLMYGDVNGGFIGTFEFLYSTSEAQMKVVNETAAFADAGVESGYSTMSDWFFQMVFVATTASIISGALAERIRLWSFFAFVAVMTALIYPTVGAWTWGPGWLDGQGFRDFAGSSIVHSAGGWAALAGALVLGPRLGKFRDDGTVKQTPPSNVPIVTLGVFILMLGWFGFNGGSVLALASANEAILMSIVLVNTALASAGGIIAALLLARPIMGRVDLLVILNGAIGGLVAITAAPDFDSHLYSIFIGAGGGAIVVLGMKLLDIMKIDDVVGAIPAHLFAGIWGTLIAAIHPGVGFMPQLIGVVAIGAFVFSASFIVWKLIDLTLGTRVEERVEHLGQDIAELGIESYPEFVLHPDEELLMQPDSD